MHKIFDAKVPRLDQVLAVAAAKKPGRKHQKRPGNKATQRAHDSAVRAAEMQTKQQRKRRNAVAAYWRGELDEYPE